MSKIKVLFVTHEMSPFLELTKISSITRQLPQAIQDKGFEIRVLMPRFGNINERRNRLHEVIRLSGMNIVINENDNPLIIKVASVQGAKMQVYFLDNEDYFYRKHVFTDSKGKFYEDNDERTIFFCKGALETVKKLGWAPDLIHCHGWMSCLVPAYLKTSYKNSPIFKDTKVIYSVYNTSFKETLGKDFSKKAIAFDMKSDDVALYAPSDCSALYMGAAHYADGIIKGHEDIDPNVEDFINKSNKPILSHRDLDNVSAVINFYEAILNEELIST